MKFSILALCALATLSTTLVSAEEVVKNVEYDQPKPKVLVKPITKTYKAKEYGNDDYGKKVKRPWVKPTKSYGGGYNNYYNQYENGYNVGRKSGFKEGYVKGGKEGFGKGQAQGSFKGQRKGVVSGWEDGVRDGVDKGYWNGYEKAEKAAERKGETAGFKQGFELGEKTGYEVGVKQGYGLAIAEAGTGKYGDLIKSLKDDWKKYFKGSHTGYKSNFGARTAYKTGPSYTESYNYDSGYKAI
ncbi:hypothetical protein K493DRAFT_390562 [Basidiobolus meristosporus CBS 931.73]|uniref:Essential protein Yae1 N-terminal domain-containing protein n=1 Tax=Basidiobolus meristosporus CBS 931.73 TaxID=1314790 RepID=A0A1Y1YS91_9FUNG|nr:hypothetical protein K493DRAFT_390562 [Basidiobolus meristosporus CBS 931.73]|eukprot:ORY00846.1 hypothetical protein K493DRAFT_390562 [Basidiobolus meristosporus CBS 931.73]